MPNFNSSCRRPPLVVAGALAGLALAACQREPVGRPSQVVDGLRFDYGVTESGPPATYGPAGPQAPMRGGPSGKTDHVTLALVDTRTNAHIDDATVMLNIKGPGYPGHGSMLLAPMAVNGNTIYGGYVSLRRPGRYRLTFHAARPGRQWEPLKAVFVYERST